MDETVCGDNHHLVSGMNMSRMHWSLGCRECSGDSTHRFRYAVISAAAVRAQLKSDLGHVESTSSTEKTVRSRN